MNWLESQGITMITTSEGGIISSAIESGQAITLTGQFSPFFHIFVCYHWYFQSKNYYMKPCDDDLFLYRSRRDNWLIYFFRSRKDNSVTLIYFFRSRKHNSVTLIYFCSEAGKITLWLRFIFSEAGKITRWHWFIFSEAGKITLWLRFIFVQKQER